MLSVLIATGVVAGVALAAMAVNVWRVRGSVAGLALAVLLLAGAWWGLAYAGELSSQSLHAREMWGDAKYLGICLVPPAWLVFVLDYTGRGRLVTWRLLAALAVPPVVVWLLLAVPSTRALVRYYVDTPAGQPPLVGAGPVFWVHLVYSNLVLLGATVLFVSAMTRLARRYRIRATLLVAAALLPWAANLLFNFGVGAFTRLDLTPFAFIVAGGVLVYGLYLPRMTNLSSVAWHRVVQTMGDGVLLVDAFGRVVDANPAAGHLLGGDAGLRGRLAAEILPRRSVGEAGQATRWGAAVSVGDRIRHLDLERELLTDSAGVAEGELVLVRDVTDREEYRHRLETLLAERTRIAATLTSSLLPARLPTICGVELASRYLPAGGDSEVGGDFFDVIVFDQARFGFVLGDVSGKGAEAAAVTGLVRYTLRAFATPDASPSAVLGQVNQAVLRATDEERYCTLVYGVAVRVGARLHLRMCLAGHPQPLVRRACGEVAAYGITGTALGLLPDPELSDTDLVLAPDDLLCLFTDGLVEARSHGHWFGEDRVHDVLHEAADDSAEDTVARLVSAVDAFQSGQPLADDLALLAIRRQP